MQILHELCVRYVTGAHRLTVRLWIAVAYVAVVYVAVRWGGGGGAQLRLTD